MQLTDKVHVLSKRVLCYFTHLNGLDIQLLLIQSYTWTIKTHIYRYRHLV